MLLWETTHKILKNHIPQPDPRHVQRTVNPHHTTMLSMLIRISHSWKRILSFSIYFITQNVLKQSYIWHGGVDVFAEYVYIICSVWFEIIKTRGSVDMQYSKYRYLFQWYQNTLGIAIYLQNIQKYEIAEFLTILASWNQVEIGNWATADTHAHAMCLIQIFVTGKNLLAIFTSLCFVYAILRETWKLYKFIYISIKDSGQLWHEINLYQSTVRE